MTIEEMKIQADANHVCVSPTWKINTGEYNARGIEVLCSEDFSDCDYVYCTFTDESGIQQRAEVINGACSSPYYEKPGYIEIGVFGEKLEEGKVVKRVSPRPVKKMIHEGSFIDCETSQFVPTPDEFADFKKNTQPKLSLVKKGEYLYEIECSNYDYDYAEEYFKSQFTTTPGVYYGCSSFRKGNYYVRNLDWTYDNTVEFVIRTPAINGRHATIGVASAFNELNKDVVETFKYNDNYKMLPFFTVDGINDAGVCANINILDATDIGHTYGTNPDTEKTYAVTMLIRYILDYASSVDESIALLSNINIYCPISYEAHIMIADKNRTVVIEFVPNVSGGRNVINVVEDQDIMTNFYISGWDYNTATAYYKPDEQSETATLNLHAMGVERYDIIRDNYGDIVSKNDAVDLAETLKYSLSYTDGHSPFWFSEFSKNYGETYGDLTIHSAQEDFATVVAVAKERFNNRSRDPQSEYFGTWHTTHTSIYDINEKTLSVYSQEDYTIGFDEKLFDTSLSENIKVATEVNIDSDNSTIPTSSAVYKALKSIGDDVIYGYYNTDDNKFYYERTHQNIIPAEDSKLYINLEPDYGMYRCSNESSNRFAIVSANILAKELIKTQYASEDRYSLNIWEIESNSGLYRVSALSNGCKIKYAQNKEIPYFGGSNSGWTAYIMRLKDASLPSFYVPWIIFGSISPESITGHEGFIYCGWSSSDGSEGYCCRVPDAFDILTSPDELVGGGRFGIITRDVLSAMLNSDYSTSTNKIATMKDIATTPHTELVVNSSSLGSNKKFKISVDDNGELSVSEYIQEDE